MHGYLCGLKLLCISCSFENSNHTSLFAVFSSLLQLSSFSRTSIYESPLFHHMHAN